MLSQILNPKEGPHFESESKEHENEILIAMTQMYDIFEYDTIM